MAREKSEGGRVLTSTEIRLGKNNFTLLNSEKLGRALDWLDEIETPKAESDQAALAAAQKMGAKKDAILRLRNRSRKRISRKRILGMNIGWSEKSPGRLPRENSPKTASDGWRARPEIWIKKKRWNEAGKFSGYSVAESENRQMVPPEPGTAERRTG